MRISAGALKGKNIGTRKIFQSKSGDAELRPTSSKVREALFDILRNEIIGASFLDLYAGSGAVGFEEVGEALSFIDKGHLLQGAGHVIIEHASKKNLDDSGLMTLRLIKTYRYGDTMLTRYRKVT